MSMFRLRQFSLYFNANAVRFFILFYFFVRFRISFENVEHFSLNFRFDRIQ